MDDKLKFPEIGNDITETKLRKENLELRTKLQAYEKLLQENGLLERLSQLSDSEIVCHQQIAKLKEISDKGIPFQIEDIKSLEILVKTLHVAQGKTPIVEMKKPKQNGSPEHVANLLQIAGIKKPTNE